MPGTDSCAGVDLRTTRLPELFSEAQRARALDIHNAVVQKRAMPRRSHFLFDLYSAEQIEENFLRPLNELQKGDYWLAFVDESDIHSWAAFLAENMTSWLGTIISETDGRFGR